MSAASTRALPRYLQSSGVYRMFDADAKLLYVGKAKSRKKRLASYFRKSGLAPKTAALVARIAQVVHHHRQ